MISTEVAYGNGIVCNGQAIQLLYGTPYWSGHCLGSHGRWVQVRVNVVGRRSDRVKESKKSWAWHHGIIHSLVFTLPFSKHHHSRPPLTMASVKPSIRHLHSCLRQAGTGTGNASLGVAATRFLSSTAAASQEAAAQANPMDKWGELDPATVDNKRDERRLIRRDGIQPIGSRRRRAALRTSAQIPFEQLPYQCFQEARKVLMEDRQEKIKQIEVQKLRLANLIAQDAAVSGGEKAKAVRVKSMQDHLRELIILADINDPMVKKRFEDGQGVFLCGTGQPRMLI